MEGTTPPSPATPTTHDTPAAYTPPSAERYAPEPDKRPGRTAFQRDRARVLHSAALRRLAGKTQVVTPGTRTHVWDASPRTRLTHSLECAQVGRELGAALGCDPDLVEAACLSHDLGHPPFGHNGEQALNEFAEDCGGFEGNAQSLRLLTRIEPKRFVRSPESGDLVSVGLNLTRAALDAATKYPWPRGAHPTDPESPKFGVYDDDRPVFDWVRKDAPGTRTTFEAQVMDWSDDVAYSVHDVEDGLHAGHIDPGCLHADPERQAVFEVARGRYVPADTDPAELAEALDRLLDQEWWPHGYDGTAIAQARLKDATSQLIGRFCLAAEGATRQAYGGGPLTRYAAELVVPREARLECAVLKAVADRYVMQRDEQERLRADQRVVVAELAEALTARAPEGLEPQFRALFDAAPDDRARKRVIVDQIASLTDTSARASHARLTGRM
ncbi:deoxyguanosinetriphosphate triphosphohydrolase [Streptomyces caniscabiei]|uniref:Deoxyguanosinetriphosphate triphosphohydrolase-like protein n=1 Tax=Streptomyces caniscabiei TaxID=2746961 RepID=A0A927L270_9ACTN|nr:deoxyguanosinetriphosphate triphosphohydrolase [Streptomyces caniscabiei]MBD9723618.1 deoxyguanosinetriphosphate triphosphohydrolase [Streptomyces caniscabiei]MDX3511102.1 deoxyguanosinetriphosphate triphosphohydrolase [Streptomyces caniscabiei]MDX3721182.1 deoxyguanosinetriphosphate triphosphohydrolase [Streptomyces caniscabiei]WEO27181.1 deoxyguanosinetriphosphate triphosphohydrolase [Streptomyces caniscabiei]